MSDLERAEDNNKGKADDGLEAADRRKFLASVVKYSAAVGGAATVIMSADEAVAWSSASGTKRHHGKAFYIRRHYRKKAMAKRHKILVMLKRRFGGRI